MEILINNQQDILKLNLALIKKIAIEIMKFEGSPDNTELSIVFCDDDFIQKLNYKHRMKNTPTDVLSFPMQPNPFEQEIIMIGDIVISVETALRQADTYKHSAFLEIVFLLLHGILHLYGHEHSKKVGKKIMKDREISILHHLCNQKLLDKLDEDHLLPVIKRTL